MCILSRLTNCHSATLIFLFVYEVLTPESGVVCFIFIYIYRIFHALACVAIRPTFPPLVVVPNDIVVSDHHRMMMTTTTTTSVGQSQTIGTDGIGNP